MFVQTYYSCEIGERKPDTKIFEYVLNDAGITPKETLFIDDLLPNIVGAKNAGLWAYYLEDESISDIFTF